ncbi:GNAT family N-acetyltransferase [Kitasatospora sp. NPDC056138]|uniref:GNAT family N-acetyltransferase n=1 Tax=Kitasatospora sp. NPDC056138 TaxID=3345724 RepID=UPI0035DF9504
MTTTATTRFAPGSTAVRRDVTAALQLRWPRSPASPEPASTPAPGSSMTTGPNWLHPHWPTELSTSRLLLRPVETRDSELLRTLWTDPEVRRFLGGPVPTDRLAQRLTDAASQRGHFTVVLVQDGRGAGRVTLDRDQRAAGRAEVSYEFLPAYAGRGFAAEAVGAVLDWGAQAVPDHQLIAVTQAANTRSRRLLDRLGLLASERFAEYGQDQVLYTTGPSR